MRADIIVLFLVLGENFLSFTIDSNFSCGFMGGGDTVYQAKKIPFKNLFKISKLLSVGFF